MAFLRDALTKHADFIVARWRKKSRDKRYTFLEAHSALYPKKWAAVHFLNDGVMKFSQGEKRLKELAAQREYVRRQLEDPKKQTPDVDATPQTVWGEDTSNASSFTPVARKTRERSPPSLGQDTRSPSRTMKYPATTTPQPEPTKIVVRRDNMAIFKAMFPEKGEDSSRSFAWQHFLAAMTDAGFSILQSQGSAVTSRLSRTEGEDKIVVHRPHPVATLRK